MKKSHNFLRSCGVDTVQLTLYLVGFGMLVAAAAIVHGWWERHKEELRAEGARAERLRWEKREREQQQAYAAELQALRAQRDAATVELQGRLEQAESNYVVTKKEHAREKAKTARIERDLRDGRLVLVDPGGAPAAGKACGGEGAAGPGPKPDGDGAARALARGLSAELSTFLWTEAGRADAVIEDLEARLTLAQDNVRAYYRLAQRCHAVD